VSASVGRSVGLRIWVLFCRIPPGGSERRAHDGSSSSVLAWCGGSNRHEGASVLRGYNDDERHVSYMFVDEYHSTVWDSTCTEPASRLGSDR